MKKIIYSLMFIGSFCLTSCVNDFLEIEPKNKQATTTAFKTYDNFKTYAWGLYGIFYEDALGVFEKDIASHIMVNNAASNNNIWAYQGVTEATENSQWNFDYIRRVNVMLDNINQSHSTLTD